MEKTNIKLSKSFGVKITAEFQAYDFSSAMEVTLADRDLSDENDRKNLKEWANWLNAQTVDATISDIKAFAGDNDNFRTLLMSRNKKIESLPSDLKIAKTSNVTI